MTSHRLHQQLLALALPVISLCPLAASGQSTWAGITNTDWGTATNWIPGVPAEGAAISIADGATNALILNAPHSISSFTFGASGTRTSGHSTQTNAHSLTIGAGGIVANGNFTGGLAPQLLGNIIASANQNWSVGGTTGAYTDDRGLAIRGNSTAAATTPTGSITLNANVTKTGPGVIMLIATSVSGAGNLVIDQGAVKLNAGNSQPLVLGGTGNVTLNGTSSLFVVRNSGTFDVTRPIIANGTSTLVFGGGNGTTIASPITWNGTAHTMPVHSSYTFTGAMNSQPGAVITKSGGGALTLSGNYSGFPAELKVTAGRININSTLPGAVMVEAGLTVGGEGTVNGPLTLKGGSLVIDGKTPGALTAAGGVTVSAATTVSLTDAPAAPGAITVLSYTGTSPGVTNFAATGIRNPVFSDTGTAITVSGNSATRTWAATAGNTWDVGTSANWTEGDNRFYQGDAVVFGDTGAGSVAITGLLSPSSITINNSETFDYFFTAAANNSIGGTGGLTKNGAGNASIGGVNTFTGNVSINGGTLKLSSNQALGAGPKTITIASGAAFDTNSALDANRDWDLVATGAGLGDGAVVSNGGTDRNFGFRSLTLNGNTTIGGLKRFDIRPNVAGTGFLALNGHTLTKSGTNWFGIVDSTIEGAGTIEIQGGTLSFARNVVSGSDPINVRSGGTFAIENYNTGSINKPINVFGGAILRGSSNGYTLTSPLTLDGASTISIAGGTSFIIGSPILGTGTFEKIDTGNLVFGADNAYTGAGPLKVNAGTVQLGAGATTGSIANQEIQLVGTTSGVIFSRTDDVTFGNVISGEGLTGPDLNPSALTKNGPNTLTLTGNNTFSGSTRLNNGTIAIGSEHQVFGTGRVDMRTGTIRSSDATAREVNNELSISEAITLGSATTGNLKFNGPVALGSQTKIVNIANAVTEFSGVIGGSGSTTFFAKAGPGTLIISGSSNTYGQITRIDSGVLQIGNGGSTGALSGSAVQNNASLVINRANSEGGTDFTFGNAISGTGSLTHSGTAYTILAAANTYTGDTIITNGTLSPTFASFDDNSAIRISGTAKLELYDIETDKVKALFFDGSPEPAGIYGSMESTAPNKRSYLAGAGLLEVTSDGTGSPFQDWASDKGLTAANDGADQDPDFDGQSNLLEFALNGEPLSGARTGNVVVKIATVGSQQALTLTLPVRSSVGTFDGGTFLTATGDGVKYTIEAGNDLGSWNLNVDEVTGTDATAIQTGLPTIEPGSGYVYRTFRSPGAVSADAKEFIRARVEEPATP